MEKNEDLGDGFIADEYSIQNPIANGAFGIVIKCKDKKGKVCAAKRIIITKDVKKQYSFVQQEIEQLKLVNKANIPNVIKFLGAFEDKSSVTDQIKVNIFFEYCEGGDLEMAIANRGPFTEAEIKMLLKPVVSCFAALHENDIVHRDLKPSNILFLHKWYPGQSCEIRLCDFGVSTKGAENFDIVCGTPAFMAPEIYKGKKLSDKIDVFAFGIIVYKMLFSVYPILDDNMRAWYGKNKGDIVIPKTRKISKECFDVLQKCLRIKQRYRISFKKLESHEFFKEAEHLTMLPEMFDGSDDSILYNLKSKAAKCFEKKAEKKERDILEILNKKIINFFMSDKT